MSVLARANVWGACGRTYGERASERVRACIGNRVFTIACGRAGHEQRVVRCEVFVRTPARPRRRRDNSLFGIEPITYAGASAAKAQNFCANYFQYLTFYL